MAGRHLRTGALTLALIGTAPALAQQSAEDFYRGKKIDMIIGYSAGGTYDLYARLVARQLPNYLPGAPTIVPRNMPGGGSRTAPCWPPPTSHCRSSRRWATSSSRSIRAS